MHFDCPVSSWKAFSVLLRHISHQQKGVQVNLYGGFWVTAKKLTKNTKQQLVFAEDNFR